MTIPQAIEKAINGGWDATKSYHWCHLEVDDIDHAVIDPAFWRALGKTEEWDTASLSACPYCHMDSNQEPRWIVEMHRLIDHLADGGDLASYFESL